jgi:hypothetical protein
MKIINIAPRGGGVCAGAGGACAPGRGGRVRPYCRSPLRVASKVLTLRRRRMHGYRQRVDRCGDQHTCRGEGGKGEGGG